MGRNSEERLQQTQTLPPFSFKNGKEKYGNLRNHQGRSVYLKSWKNPTKERLILKKGMTITDRISYIHGVVQMARNGNIT